MKASLLILAICFSLASAAAPGTAQTSRTYVQGVESQLEEWDERAVRLQAEAQKLPDDSARQRELTQSAELINESVKEIRGELAVIAAAPESSKDRTMARIDRELGKLRRESGTLAE